MRIPLRLTSAESAKLEVQMVLTFSSFMLCGVFAKLTIYVASFKQEYQG